MSPMWDQSDSETKRLQARAEAAEGERNDWRAKANILTARERRLREALELARNLLSIGAPMSIEAERKNPRSPRRPGPGGGTMSLTRTHTRTHDRFGLNRTLPEKIIVREITPEDHATQVFAVCLDYGWAETTLGSGFYEQDANDVAATVAEFLDIPVELSDPAPEEGE